MTKKTKPRGLVRQFVPYRVGANEKKNSLYLLMNNQRNSPKYDISSSKRHMTEDTEFPSFKKSKSPGSNSILTNIDNRNFGFVDIKKLEHSARILQKNLKLIIDEAPDIEKMNELIDTKLVDSLTFDSLKTNKLVHLTAQLKSLYDQGKLDIIDRIIDNDIDLEVVKLEVDRIEKDPLPQITDIINSNSEAELEDENLDNYCPELPLIKDHHLEERVFIHKSTMNNKSYLLQSELINSHNERLEFLGDSVLNNIATLILYERYPTAPEGELSKMRSILVNNVTLAEFSIKYGFDKKLKSNINDAILRQGKQKIFADIFEAYVGALSIENEVQSRVIHDWLFKLYLKKLKQFDDEIKLTEEVNKDAKSELYSLVGTAAFHPIYRVLETGDGAAKNYQVQCMMGHEVLGTGIAPGLKEAGLRAAMVALKNKQALEKYIQLRLNTDKTQSVVGPAVSKSTAKPVPSLPQSNVNIPLVAPDDLQVDNDARNRLYAFVSKHYNVVPEYQCEEVGNQLFTAELKINNILLASAMDLSKKRAMAKAAKVVLDNMGVLNSIGL